MLSRRRSTAKYSSPVVATNLTENGRVPESQNALLKGRHLVKPFDWTSASDVPAVLWAEQRHGLTQGELECGLSDQTRYLIALKAVLMTSSRPSASRLPAMGCPAIEPA